MKKRLTQFVLLFALCGSLSSCWTYTAVVGEGSQTGEEIKKKNHYLIVGLVDLETSDPKVMAGSTTNYEVTTEHTFVDGLLQAITFGIYSPTTTTVRK